MSSILKIFENLFDGYNSQSSIERINKFILEFKINSNLKLTNKSIKPLIDLFEFTGDSWTLSVKGEQSIYLSDSTINELDFWLKEFNSLESENSYIECKIEVFKSEGCSVFYIYNSNAYRTWLIESKRIQLLKTFSRYINEHGYINFIILDSLNSQLVSDRICINYANNPDKELFDYKEYANFDQSSTYPYLGEDFEIRFSKGDNLGLENILQSFSYLFAVTSMFDVTWLSDDFLKYKLKGFKQLKGSLNFEKLNSNYAIYLKINKWVYGNKANISDKIGIARNIISLQADNNLIVESSIFGSIISSYNFYLKENVSQYLSVRSKLNLELKDIIKEIQAAIQELRFSFNKSNFIYVSFFISVIVFRVLNKAQFSDIFTKDATVLFIAFIAISFVYLMYTYVSLNTQKERIKNRYKLLKKKNEDIFNSADIKLILNGDKEFNDEIKYLEKTMKSYFLLWGITMFILFVAVFILSEYLRCLIFVVS